MQNTFTWYLNFIPKTQHLGELFHTSNFYEVYEKFM